MYKKIFVLLTIYLFNRSLFAQLSVKSTFEGGNVEIIKIDNDNNIIDFRPALKAKNTIRCWFYFMITGVDTSQTLILRNHYEGNWSFRAPNNPVFSYDNENWQKLSTSDYNYYYFIDDYKEYKYQFKNDTVYFAVGHPYLYSDLKEYLFNISNNQFLNISTLTYSENGNMVPLLQISNTFDNKTKDLIWLTARMHAFESPSNYFMEGVINFLLSDETLAKFIRTNSMVYIIPMMDVDNVIKGGSGKNQYPIDFNRDFNKTSHWNATKAMRKKIMETSKKHNYRMFFDIHSPYPGSLTCNKIESHYFNNYGQNHIKAAKLDTLFSLFAKYDGFKPWVNIDTIVLENLINSDHFSDNLNCKKNGTPHHASIYFASTYEQAWNYRYDGTKWEPESYRKSGYAFGKAIAEYFYIKVHQKVYNSK